MVCLSNGYGNGFADTRPVLVANVNIRDGFRNESHAGRYSQMARKLVDTGPLLHQSFT